MKRTLMLIIVCLACAIALIGCSSTPAPTGTRSASPVATSTSRPTTAPTPTIAPTVVRVHPTPKPTATPTVDVTTLPAYQMAVIDGQEAIPDSATVAIYQKLLDSLSNKTGESNLKIANDTVAGQNSLTQANYTGVDRLITLMQSVDSAITKDEHMTYEESLAALITIMEGNG